MKKVSAPTAVKPPAKQPPVPSMPTALSLYDGGTVTLAASAFKVVTHCDLFWGWVVKAPHCSTVETARVCMSRLGGAV
jgi:hypothetical protein